jgi:collagen triple helix repeat protein
MLSRLREHFGTAGLVVAIVALSVALAGGAIAANGGGGKATASAKAKKGPRGPKGAKGDTGAAGPAGPAGAQGPKGDTGSAGEEGEKGKEGKAGKDGANGVDGVDGVDGIDGATGPTGPEGSPWTDLDVLPPGETETGAWSFGTTFSAAGLGQQIFVPFSFTIPLPAPLGPSNVHYLNAAGLEGGNPSTACQGSAADPKAAPGHFCVYTGEESLPSEESSDGFFLISNESIADPALPGLSGAARSGAVIAVVAAGASAKAIGTWAVTAPTAP